MTQEQRMKILLHGFRYLGFAFRNVIATVTLQDGTRIDIEVPGVVYSEYQSGPSLFHLAEWVSYTYGSSYPIQFIGFKSATPLGRQTEAI
jgi:hypothetical protein